MNILALDPATLTGYALNDESRTSGVWDLARDSKRLKRLHQAILNVQGVHPLSLIAYEVASFGSRSKTGAKNAAAMCFHERLRGVIEFTAEWLGIATLPLTPSQIKSFATGNGRAKKPQMIAACRTLLGREVKDDNEADALFILALAEQWVSRGDSMLYAKPKKPRTRRRGTLLAAKQGKLPYER